MGEREANAVSHTPQPPRIGSLFAIRRRKRFASRVIGVGPQIGYISPVGNTLALEQSDPPLEI